MDGVSKMITKFIYCNPNDSSSSSNQEKASHCPSETYDIVDTSLGASIKASVPTHLTVLHELFPSERMNASVSGNKLRVYLVGSEKCPDMLGFSQSPINRIEFHGSICYERPVFEMISQLKRVQKVKFFLGCKQLPQFFHCSSNIIDKEWINPSVTSLTILLENNFSLKVDQKRRDLMENIMEDMILAFLNRCGKCFPNLRKVTVDAPNTVKINTSVLGLIRKLCYLKQTRVEFNDAGDRILVKKVTQAATPASLVKSDNDKEIKSDGPESKKLPCQVVESGKDDDAVSEEQELKNDSEADVENNMMTKEDQQNLINSDEKEENSNKNPKAGTDKTPDENSELDQEHKSDDEESLTGLGKLLESMLGIRDQVATSSPEVPSSEEILLPDVPKEEVPQPILPVSSNIDTTVENKNAVIVQSPETCDKSVSTEDDNDEGDCDDENDSQFDESDASINLDATMTLETAQSMSPTNSLLEPEQLNPQPRVQFQPIAHHPLCYQNHEYLGVPIIPGFAISVNYSPAYPPPIMSSHHSQHLQSESIPIL